ncbi:MAG: hypothetical protein JWO67_930 [Streptosporangiaceae bacterium]|nr:hypothetical protein [Streptosporangiaceae bacterium]
MRKRQRQIQTANLIDQVLALYRRCLVLEREKSELEAELAGVRDYLEACSAPPQPAANGTTGPISVPPRLIAALNSVPAEGNVVHFPARDTDGEVIAIVGGDDPDPVQIWDYIRKAGGATD